MLDFRSDTVTKPTPDMMQAIAGAEVGDAGRGDDPTVKQLEETAAAMTGKEAALFVPSGTMGNLACLLAHLAPGEEAILEASSHIYNSEAGGISAVASAIPRAVESDHLGLKPDAVEAAIKVGDGLTVARTGLICLENTRNAPGGVVMPIERAADIDVIARAAGIPVHLDGARLFNAAAYLDRPIADLCRHADSVMIALSKGLSAPIGSVVAGSAGFIAKARKKAKMLGGSMRQAGLIAAPALVALENPYPQLQKDHAMARRLAEGLRTIDERLVDMASVQTNIVNCYLDAFAAQAPRIVQGIKDEGVRALTSQNGLKIRFVTHRHIDEDGVDACIAATRRVFAQMQAAA